MFSFGQSSLSVLGQAFESLGQIVAPIEDEDKQSKHDEDKHDGSEEQEEREDEEEENDDFESHIKKFIDQRRDELSTSVTITDTPSPTSSLVDVALDDDSLHRHYYNSVDEISHAPESSNESTQFDYEKDLQLKYRDKLEMELRAFNQRYQQLQTQSDLTINLVQEESERWKQKVMELQATIAPSSTYGDEGTALVESLNKKCSYLQIEIDRMQQERGLFEENNRNLMNIVSELESSLEEQQNTHKEAIRLFEAEKNSLSEALRAEQQMLNQRNAEFLLQTEYLQNIEKTNKFLQEKLEKRDGQLVTQESMLVCKDSEIASLDTRLHDCECIVKDLQAKLDAISFDLQTSKVSCEDKIKLIHELEETKQNLEQQYSAALSDVRNQNVLVSGLEVNIKKLQDELRIQQENATIFTQRLQLAENECQRFRSALDNNSANNSSQLQQELFAVQSQLDKELMGKSTMEGEIQKLELRISQLDQTNQYLEDTLLQSENNLKEMEEAAWKSKAEAAEYLNAYELELRESSKLRKQVDEIQEARLDWCEQISDMLHLTVESDDRAFQSGIENLRKSCSLLDSNAATAKMAKTLLEIRQKITTLVGDNAGFKTNLEEILSLQPIHDDKMIIDSVRLLMQSANEYQVSHTEMQSNLQQLQTVMDGQVELIASLEQKVLTSDRIRAEQLLELEKLRSDLHEEKLQKDNAVEILQDQLREAKASISRMETDNKNLQVVIGQLRNAGRTKTGEAESIQLELQQLKSLNNNLLKDAEEYKRLLKRFEKFDIIVQERDQYQLKLQQLELQISDMKLHQALTEKDLYAKSTANDILQSELKMMKHDLDQRLEEVNNLQDAIQQMQSEHKYEINHFKSMIQEAHKQVNLEKLAEVLKEKEELVNQITDLDGQNKKLREQCEDQLLLRRQIELSFHQEKRKMQQSLEQVVAQMKNSTHDVIDRTLIANLIVSYFQRRRSLEVLQLIAKVLCFNEDQLIIVGLKVPPLNLFTSIFSTVLGPPDPVPVEGENLAEMWVNYLIKQAEDDNKGKSNTQQAVTASKSPEGLK